MTDCIEETESRNREVGRIAGGAGISELLCAVFSLVLLAGSPLFHAWVRGQIIRMGYRVQQLQVEEESLLRVRRNLILEEAALENPGRIEKVALDNLKMVRLRAGQIILSPPRGAEPARPGALALAGSKLSGFAAKTVATD